MFHPYWSQPDNVTTMWGHITSVTPSLNSRSLQLKDPQTEDKGQCNKEARVLKKPKKSQEIEIII